MKNKLSAIALIAFSLIGCNKMSREENLSAMKYNETARVYSDDFCSLTSREPALHFGLDRAAGTNMYVYTQTQLNTGLGYFHANFRYFESGTVQNLDSSKQTLSVSELTTLYSVLQSDSGAHYNPDSTYSALRLHFAMEGKRVIIIYEPVALIPIGATKDCTVSETGLYFRVDSVGSFNTVSSSLFSLLTGNLRGSGSKMHINHPMNTGIYSFINTYDSTGDIRSNIISFQQLTKMYCDNTDGTNSSDRINFTIVANQNEALTSNFRMHVVPNFNLGAFSPSTGTYAGYAADFVKMCPVSCNLVQVNYYE